MHHHCRSLLTHSIDSETSSRRRTKDLQRLRRRRRDRDGNDARQFSEQQRGRAAFMRTTDNATRFPTASFLPQFRFFFPILCVLIIPCPSSSDIFRMLLCPVLSFTFFTTHSPFYFSFPSTRYFNFYISVPVILAPAPAIGIPSPSTVRTLLVPSGFQGLVCVSGFKLKAVNFILLLPM